MSQYCKGSFSMTTMHQTKHGLHNSTWVCKLWFACYDIVIFSSSKRGLCLEFFLWYRYHMWKLVACLILPPQLHVLPCPIKEIAIAMVASSIITRRCSCHLYNLGVIEYFEVGAMDTQHVMPWKDKCPQFTIHSPRSIIMGLHICWILYMNVIDNNLVVLAIISKLKTE